MDISGTTKLVGIVGHPLEHTLSPAMHNAAFQALGLDYVYVPLPVAPEEFHQVVEAIAKLGFVGFNVTMPYKEEILAHLDDVASYAQIAGAVNTVQRVGDRLVGYNTDGRGFVAALEKDAGFTPKEANAVVIGAGGAACAAVLSLALGGAAHITIVNRSPERAARLAQRVGERLTATEIDVASPFEDLSHVMADVGLVVNATPVGMAGMPGMPLPAELLSPSQLVVDMIYEPQQTEFLKAAADVGAATMNGLGMLVYQGASAFEIWTEMEPPLETMREAAVATLAGLSASSAPLEVEA